MALYRPRLLAFNSKRAAAEFYTVPTGRIAYGLQPPMRGLPADHGAALDLRPCLPCLESGALARHGGAHPRAEEGAAQSGPAQSGMKFSATPFMQ